MINELRPLETPINIREVANAARKLRNGKACGIDKIPAELLKYGPDSLFSRICEILNRCFEEGENQMIGEGIVIPIPKPGKKPGILKNLRPITLLPALRKVLANVFTARVAESTESYLSPAQCAYRPRRSTTDVVWSMKWIVAKCVSFQQTKLTIVGIDMSSAFDTIERRQVTDIYGRIDSEDTRRIAAKMLSDTQLRVQVGTETSEPFETNIGSPQGDSASGVNFNVYLEETLSDFRTRCPGNAPQTDHTYVLPSPDESSYADDVDFLCLNQERQDFIQENIESDFLRHNLIINADKTEITTIERSEVEHWRKCKKLGSLLGDREDMTNRKNLATVALNKLKSIWTRSQVRLEKRLMMYRTLVKTILLYNSETWAMGLADEERMDSFHRKQLRRVLNIMYPARIGNASVYERTSESPLRLDILERRWRFFGHALRHDLSCTGWKAMYWYFDQEGLRRYRGRPRATILTTLNRDITNLHAHNPTYTRNQGIIFITNIQDILCFREIALNRQKWKNLTTVIYTAAKVELSRRI